MEAENLKKLGERIRRIRLEKGLSQVELAHRCDLEKGNMYRLESGGTNPTFKTLLKVAKALDVSIDELVRGTDVI